MKLTKEQRELKRRELKQLQSLPLKIKIEQAKMQIKELILQFPDFYISFSGGKDSEVALDLTAQCCAELGIDTLHVLNIDTGLEYSSVHKFCRTFCDYISQKYSLMVILNTDTPKTDFADVLRIHGYPLFSKEISQCIEEARKGIKNGDGSYQYRIERLKGTYKNNDGTLSSYNMPRYQFLLNSPIRISSACCSKLKKEPVRQYEKLSKRIPIIATTVEESRLRRTRWMLHGSNSFGGKRPVSAPLSTWTSTDVLQYIKISSLPIAKAYGEIILSDYGKTGYCTTGCSRTGCIYCLFGIAQDPLRILRLQSIEPQRADYMLRGGCFDDEGFWIPDENGLGYWFILDYLNSQGFGIPYINKEYRKNNMKVPYISNRQLWLFELDEFYS